MLPKILIDAGDPPTSDNYGIPKDAANNFGMGKFWPEGLSERFRKVTGRDMTAWEMACDWYELDIRILEAAAVSK